MNDSRLARRPRIGITTYQQPARWGDWAEPAAFLSATYVECIAAAGGVPLMMPPIGTDPSIVDDLDGLIIAGGSDVDPERYGAHPHALTSFQSHRDDHDLALTEAAISARLPLLAICRGLQVVNVVRGGTLVQHLPDVIGADTHQPAPGEFARMEVETVPGTRVASILGERAPVSVYHHQGVERVGDGLVVTAHATDGTIQALEFDPASEVADQGWMLAVQWHPERDIDDLRVFEAFTAAAAAHRSRVPADHSQTAGSIAR